MPPLLRYDGAADGISDKVPFNIIRLDIRIGVPFDVQPFSTAKRVPNPYTAPWQRLASWYPRQLYNATLP